MRQTGWILAASGVLIACLAGCGSTGHHGAAKRHPAVKVRAAADVSAFAYRPVPFALRRRLINPGHGLRVYDLSYASPIGGRVPAYLVIPPGSGRRPAVIYLHGSGGDRREFLSEAVWMASRGAVGLLIDSAQARATGVVVQHGLAGLRQQRDLEAETVVDLRRAVDLLQTLPQVDPHRLAFSGWSAGARAGAILAGVEHRIGSFDLISGGSPPLATFVAAAPASMRTTVRKLLTSVDPLTIVRGAAPGSLFFQDGRRDQEVPHAALVGLIQAAPPPTRVRWYPSGHAPTSSVYHDALRWLSHRLGLAGPVIAGLPAGP